MLPVRRRASSAVAGMHCVPFDVSLRFGAGLRHSQQFRRCSTEGGEEGRHWYRAGQGCLALLLEWSKSIRADFDLRNPDVGKSIDVPSSVLEKALALVTALQASTLAHADHGHKVCELTAVVEKMSDHVVSLSAKVQSLEGQLQRAVQGKPAAPVRAKRGLDDGAGGSKAGVVEGTEHEGAVKI
mmetsp:Transcript_12411/g.31339  ORF Transcript_12411/g.31339 Transcript_12411/m.31339 type:complete len:184 (-) Transcript_12411:758-1309(-)